MIDTRRRGALWRIVLAGFATSAFALSIGGGNVAANELKVGDPAPPFTLPGSDGRVHTLGDYKGKVVVLAWFPKAFTGG
jgi:thioredoxin-dependent peroxiredoxin